MKPALLVIAMVLAACTHASAGEAVPQKRIDVLARGINLSHWFSQSRGYSDQHLQSFITDHDLKLIRSMGFSWVRFAVDPEILWNSDDPGALNPGRLKLMDEAIARILAHGLALSVDMHPPTAFKKRLKGDEAVADFAKFWQSLAGHLAGTDPDRIFLEVLNEPELDDAPRWQSVQGTLLAAMRAGAPRHTLIATADRWSAVDQLLKLKPYQDRNIIYNMHCYDPSTFTHQGASWGFSGWRTLRNIPWPGTAEAVEQILPELPEEGRGHARTYARQNWDAQRLRKLIDQAGQWARQHDVPLICNEFGVYRRFSRPEHRAAYLRDLVTALEANGIGWAMWDYRGGFAVVNPGPDGVRVPDEQTVKALGLGQDR
jgi:endoglucanase